MPTPGKQTIYVDVDDEITTVIDKMNETDARVIALVLPKRAAMFQSVVNMKLLKRRAESASKHLVLITSETSLLPLAGMAGIHVAKTLQSKPEIPGAPAAQPDTEDVDESIADVGPDFNPHEQAATPVGQLAGGAAASIVRPSTLGGDDNEVIELDNAETPKAPTKAPNSAVRGAGPNGTPLKGKSKSQLAVPDFIKFRRWLLIGIVPLLALLVGGYIVAFRVLPAAVVTIGTNTSDVNASLNLTLDSASGASLNTANKVIPAQATQQQKNYSQQVPASGKKNTGEKAKGQVVISQPCSSNVPGSVPAGTGVSSNGLTYITQDTVNFSPTVNNGNCVFQGSTNVTAQQPGAQYNIGPADFTVASGGTGRSDSGMTGGTDNIVKVVTQSDIDAAKQKLNTSNDQASYKQQLQSALQSNQLFALPATFSAKPAAVNISAKPDDQTDNVTVSENVTYVMYGVRKDDLSKLVTSNAEKQIDTSRQSILDDGIDKASFTARAASNATQVPVVMDVTSTAGPQLDKNQLLKQVVGKKTGDVKSAIQGNPGVKSVDVTYSPFYVTSMPNNESKITIRFVKAGSDGGQ